MSFNVLIRLTCDTPGCVARSRNLKSALKDLKPDMVMARRVARDGGWTREEMAFTSADFCPKCSAMRKAEERKAQHISEENDS